MVGGVAHTDLRFTVSDTVDETLSIPVSQGCSVGTPQMPFSFLSPGDRPLWQVLHTTGTRGAVIKEAKTGKTYQYVSQCSGRGLCQDFNGLCRCFTGYSGEACSRQNELSF